MLYWMLRSISLDAQLVCLMWNFGLLDLLVRCLDLLMWIVVLMQWLVAGLWPDWLKQEVNVGLLDVDARFDVQLVKVSHGCVSVEGVIYVMMFVLCSWLLLDDTWPCMVWKILVVMLWPFAHGDVWSICIGFGFRLLNLDYVMFVMVMLLCMIMVQACDGHVWFMLS